MFFHPGIKLFKHPLWFKTWTAFGMNSAPLKCSQSSKTRPNAVMWCTFCHRFGLKERQMLHHTKTLHRIWCVLVFHTVFSFIWSASVITVLPGVETNKGTSPRCCLLGWCLIRSRLYFPSTFISLFQCRIFLHLLVNALTVVLATLEWHRALQCSLAKFCHLWAYWRDTLQSVISRQQAVQLNRHHRPLQQEVTACESKEIRSEILQLLKNCFPTEHLSN